MVELLLATFLTDRFVMTLLIEGARAGIIVSSYPSVEHLRLSWKYTRIAFASVFISHVFV